MKSPSEAGPGLSARRAFVVQFHIAADLERGRATGRVEHVASGQARHFVTIEELVAFMAQVLATLDVMPPEEP